MEGSKIAGETLILEMMLPSLVWAKHTIDLGNLHVKKLSYDKFSCKKIFVGTTPYRISVNSAC